MSRRGVRAIRRPAAEAVLANTLAQLAILRPDPQSGSMRDLFASLMALDDVNRRIGEMMTGLSTRDGLDSPHDDVGRLIGDRTIRPGEGDVALYGRMQDGAAVSLDASAGATASMLVARLAPRVRCIAIAAGESMLIRPDACVAWAGEAAGTDGLEDALRRWLGSARNHVSPMQSGA